MRVIEEKMLTAIEEKKDMSLSNTQVLISGNVAKVYLHGNLICKHNYKTGKRTYSNCGWLTNTTKSRLNALGAGIQRRNKVWYNENGEVFKNDF